MSEAVRFGRGAGPGRMLSASGEESSLGRLLITEKICGRKRDGCARLLLTTERLRTVGPKEFSMKLRVVLFAVVAVVVLAGSVVPANASSHHRHHRHHHHK